MNLVLCFLLLITTVWRQNVKADPVGTGGPSVVSEGKDALLTCVIMGPYSNDTVLWKKGPNEILSAGMNRVTNDKRISVLHDESPKGKTPTGGDVWVLLIKDTKPSDTAVYVCEVNSDPIVKSFHPLRVKSLNLSTTKPLPPISQNTSAGIATAPTIKSYTINGSSTTSTSSSSSASSSSTSISSPSSSSSSETSSPSSSSTYAEYPLLDNTYGQQPPLITHDFTDCCQSMNVTELCMGFCAVHNIIDGTTGAEPESCEKDFPKIVKCMADGRNHQPCCKKSGVPDICQDMCLGEYTPYTDYAKSRISCVQHTLPTLKCILQGIQTIPSEPENVIVEPLNEKSLHVTWTQPARLANTVKTYSINVTALHTFDQDEITNMTKEISVVVSNEIDSAIINDLKPFTMYSITVTANNDDGSSLPSYRVRALTLENGSTQQTSVAVVPILPDIQGCCLNHGMTHRTCLDRMCDPKKADFTEIPDLMVCAPWANITFSCLANKIDHTPCCKARGIPDTCLSFCTGIVTSVTYNSFKCLQYMSQYSSCLLQGYGVLAGPPSRVKAPMVSSHFAIVEWQAPKILPDTVIGYDVSMRKLASGDEYTVIDKHHSPVILEGLEAGVYYEVFVVAINAHGLSGQSPRLVFRTKHEIETDEEDDTPAYNITSCCMAAGLLPQCMPLCTYDVKMSDLSALGSTCQPQMGALAKCAAGGRDHTPCCQRRSVPAHCLALCRGVVPHSMSDCMSYSGNIIQCLEDGTEIIPGPIENLHATTITNTSIFLEWIPYQSSSSPSSSSSSSSMVLSDSMDATAMTTTTNINGRTLADGAVAADKNTSMISSSSDTAVDYLVQYGKVNNMTMYETIVKLEHEINTTDTKIELHGLDPSALYRILVVARGMYGTSLPSSMLLINTSFVDNETTVHGAPSPPHSLSVAEHSATWVRISWQPPEFSNPHEIIIYKLYHKSTSADKFSMIETRLLMAPLNNLKPNSQHIIYVVAVGRNGESLASETLVAWTDPALPAFVDPPTIHPTDIINEGSKMTILCLALGNPAPTISLYVGGHLVRQDTSRHMVTIIQNVTTDMEHVSCYADNGYGIPMQASKRVHISFAPQIKASAVTLAMLGERVELKCTVRAKPTPKVIFWRDHEGRVPVIVGKNYETLMEMNSEDPSTLTMTLSILKLTNELVGDYFCHAENNRGVATNAVSVRIRPVPAAHNISECCAAQNVSSACMDACSFYIDIDSIKDRPECIVDFDKLMKCAADGSDHRTCCASADVPRHCLNWCRGEPVIGAKGVCVLQHTKTIIDCFQMNRDRLPSPPLNVAVLVLSDDEAQISWEPPLKNPHMVEGYRLYWREVDSITDDLLSTRLYGIGSHRADTKELTIKLSELRPNVIYELMVKAGNVYGASILTNPVWFKLGDNQITSASNSNTAGTVFGILAGIISIALGVAGIVFYQRRRSVKSANGVAFENPSYLREVNMEHVQISAVSAPSVTASSTTTTSGGGSTNVGGYSSSGNGMNNLTNGNSFHNNHQQHQHHHHHHQQPHNNGGGSEWRNENLQAASTSTIITPRNIAASDLTVSATEVNPSLYEELKLGHEGVGFKRLVS